MVYMVEFVTNDMEGTFREPIGIASTPELAEQMKEIHLRNLLKRRDAHAYCTRCRFGRALHNPDDATRKELESFRQRSTSINDRLDKLYGCPFVSDPPSLRTMRSTRLRRGRSTPCPRRPSRESLLSLRRG